MQNISAWPVFELNSPPQDVKFWEQRQTLIPRLPENILIEGEMLRIGRCKPNPEMYHFALYSDGQLHYAQTNIKSKGYIPLDLSIMIKKVELKNCESPKNSDEERLIQAIRIGRYKDVSIYIWNHKSQQEIIIKFELRSVTNQWYKRMAQFCVCQNFEGFYRIQETIDQGAFSTVFLVAPCIVDEFQQGKYAAKVYSKELFQKLPSEQIHNFIKNECLILRKVKNRYIVQLSEVIQLNDAVMLILEYIIGGTLQKYVSTNLISELIACQVCLQLTQALQDVHRLGFVHRDIKLENIMLNSQNYEIKLIDFGFAEQINRHSLLSGQGTAGYIAPELFLQKPYNEQCDVYSLGIVFYTLLSGVFPFKTKNYAVLMQANKEGKIEYNQDDWYNVSSSAQRIVQRMLEPKAIKRLTIMELIIMLEMHVKSLKSNKKVESLQLTKCKISSLFSQVEKQPQKSLQAIDLPNSSRSLQNDDDEDEDELQQQERSIDVKNILHLKLSQTYYNKHKWVN